MSQNSASHRALVTCFVTVDAYPCALAQERRVRLWLVLGLRRLLLLPTTITTITTLVYTMPVAISTSSPSSGLKPYYQAKIEAAELEINQKTQNLRRLEAQRNALNARGKQSLLTRLLRREAGERCIPLAKRNVNEVS